MRDGQNGQPEQNSSPRADIDETGGALKRQLAGAKRLVEEARSFLETRPAEPPGGREAAFLRQKAKDPPPDRTP